MEELSIKQDLLNWNFIKTWIELKERRRFFINSREVWNIYIWKNIWYESFWKWDFFTRPVLVIKIVGSMVFAVSMTTNWKDNNKFYYKLDDKYFNKSSYITLSQVKILDKKRFINKIWMIEEPEFEEIKKELKNVLF
jgi:mRNA-degrading endonuclease toxin of MazEF toxin-antitoxin module